MHSATDEGERILLEKFRTSELRRFPKGALLIGPDDPPRGMFLIEHGFVKDYSISLNGSEQINFFFQAGDLLPIRLLLKERPRQTYFEAITSTTTRFMPKEDFVHLLETTPEVSLSVLYRLIDIANLYETRIEGLGMKTAREKIISRLIASAERFGRETPGGLLLDAPITHDSMADSMGLARETTTRILNELQREGFLARQGRKILLKDVGSLRRLITG